MVRQQRRLQRQIEALARAVPPARGMVDAMLAGRMRWLRIPLALVLILGGLVGFLPVLGLWMLPLGLLLLAVDVPAIQPWVSSLIIRGRRRLRGWLRRRRAR